MRLRSAAPLAVAVTISGGVVAALATTAVVTAVAPEVHPTLPRASEVPDLFEASTIPIGQPTRVLAADGSLVAVLRPEQLHVTLSPSELTPAVRTAVVAAEDGDFWRHPGVDVQAVLRSALANIRAGEVEEGGSTITQQLAKNLFTDKSRTLERKLDELRLAVALEEKYSKEEILTAYLNTTYFGEQAIGLGAAARAYFGKDATQLTLSEAALLAGIIPGPERWNPRVVPEEAEVRRRAVLDRIEVLGLVPKATVDAARAERPQLQAPVQGSDRFPYFVDYVRRYLTDVLKLTPEEVHGGGLVVQTTLDPVLQDAVQNAVFLALPDADDPQAAVAVVSPQDGSVRALVGGRDWAGSKVNMALGQAGGGADRQPGSSFKPFVLATVVERGRSTYETVPAPAEYTPAGAKKPMGNYDRAAHGVPTIRSATAHSYNTSFVILTEAVGANAVANTARSLGIDIPDFPGPSIGIGAYEASPLEMASGYAGFAADGKRVNATPVRKVLRPDGSAVPLPQPIGLQVVKAQTARVVTDVLRGVITSGTGRGANIGRPAAGKTGTSDDHGNAWFVGYTPQLVTAVWVGFPEGNVPMLGINGVARVTGGTIPASIWRSVMTFAHKSLPVVDFKAPEPERQPEPVEGVETETDGDERDAEPGAPTPKPSEPERQNRGNGNGNGRD